MIVPLLLLAASLAGLAAALTQPGLLDAVLLAVPCAIASLILLLAAWPRRARGRGRARGLARTRGKQIILDGSNVMHWRGDGPDLGAVREAVTKLSAQGFTPGVVFDANVGYKLIGRYQNDAELGRLLGLPRKRVMVVSKGVPADRIILRAARDLGAQVVTNDRFRDWAEAHPEIAREGHLVRGGYRAGKLWLELDEGA